MNSILFSHPTGNANVRQAALALEEAHLLEEFWTCLSWNPNSPLNRFLPKRLRQQLLRRALPPPLQRKTHHLIWLELARLLSGKLAGREIFSIDAVYRHLDQTVAARLPRLPGLRAVYAYEDGAAATFTAAKNLGIARIYELPIGYWRAAHAIYQEEIALQPDWANTLTGARDSQHKLQQKDLELQLADEVIVASRFTRDSLAAFPGPPKVIHVLPYGAPEVLEYPIKPAGTGGLKVLFAGALGQRKGLSYLLEAVASCSSAVELTLIGRKTSDSCIPLNQALSRHRWIPSLPHQQMINEMANHDLLVLPSLFEGFGLVLLEAMAQGLPIITTAHTAGPDLITDGVEGFIVPIRSSDAIAGKLLELHANREQLQSMKEAARANAKKRSWQAYRQTLGELVGRAAHGCGNSHVTAGTAKVTETP